jgi:uroporphyrinogen-III decarboxylase
MEINLQPLIMAEWVHRGSGVRYDSRYFNDPEYRAVQNLKIQKWLHKTFPRLFDLPAEKEPSTFNIGVGETFITIPSLFGAEIRYFENYNPDVGNPPLAHISSLKDVKVPDVENTWPMNIYLEQYDKLAAKYGKERVNLLRYVNKVTYPNYGTFIEGWSHSPLTIAYKLRGDKLFVDMVENENFVKHLISVIILTIQKLLSLLAKLKCVEINLMYIPCCIASVVGPKVFTEWDIPAMVQLMKSYSENGGIHSCGPSANILNELSKLPELIVLELGEGTDMAKARRLWPKSLLRYILDTYELINSPEMVGKKVKKVIKEAGTGPLTIQLPVEWGTPKEVLDIVYDTVFEHNEKEHGVASANVQIFNMGIHTC